MLVLLFLSGALGELQGIVVPVQVDKDNIDDFIKSVPEQTGVMMEFYAHWCPACQHFAPTYEKVAKYFNSEPHVQPAITVARIDCADEVWLACLNTISALLI